MQITRTTARIGSLGLIIAAAAASYFFPMRTTAGVAGPSIAATPLTQSRAVADHPSSGKPSVDRSGQTRLGKGSFYADSFFYRKMADGKKMDPHANNAASRTLPLGTTAKVTNLDTGKSAIVTIQDRGPYVDGRIVDLSPATARRIGLTQKQGITRVAVAPIAVPMPNGEVKLGAAAENPKVAFNLNTYKETLNRSGW